MEGFSAVHAFQAYAYGVITRQRFQSTNSLGHGSLSHSSVSRPPPLQLFPPICGIGELQSRMRVILPTPQVTEQEDQGDQ